MSQERHVVIELGAREQRAYDRLRALVRPVVPGASSDLRDLLLAFPDLFMLLTRLLRDDRVKPGDKAIALLGVAYVVSPLDLLPAWLFGPLGVLDDALVVAATLSRLVNHVHPDVVRSHWSGQGDALAWIQRAGDWSERQFGSRVRGAFRRLMP
ncbi:MAG: YkvA family protein [Myxococcota bacterium]